MLAVAALVLALFGAGTLWVAYRLRRRASQALKKRIELISRSPRPSSESAAGFGGLLKASTEKFDDRLRRLFAIGMKNSWAMRTRSLTLLLASATCAAGSWSLSHTFFHFATSVSLVICLLAAFLVSRAILSREQTRAERAFTDRFPDAVDTVARVVRAGLPITAAVRTVAIEASPPISTVFATVADQLKIGVPIEEMLDESSATIGLPDFRFFATAVGLQYSTGGNLTNTLESLSDIMRKRRAARLKAKAATGEIRITAYTLAAIPIVTTGALLVIQPGYLVPLWTDPRGHFIIAAAAVCLFAAFVSVRAMMRSVTSS